MDGPGPSEATYAASCVGLLVGELDGLLLGLRAVHLHGHAAGADLEVDGGGADADQGRAVHCEPLAPMPWQVAQLASKSFSPSSTSSR